jgi:mannose-6-phosphate isomerase-like protein (cupin superfamily)
MSSPPEPPDRTAVFLAPGAGRAYPMGLISAVFKADGAETRHRYSISEWWLEPHTQGPGAHSHAEDDVFFVLEGTMSFLIGDGWTEARRGSFVLVPGGVRHDFENRGSVRSGVLNFSVPGDFEQHMPDIARWFAEHPPGRAGDDPSGTASAPLAAPEAARARGAVAPC